MKRYSFLQEYIMLYPQGIDNKIIQIVNSECDYLYGKDFTGKTLLSDIMDTNDFLEILSKISKNYNIRTNFPQKIYHMSKNLNKITFEQFVYIIKEFVRYYYIRKKDSDEYGIIQGDIGKIASVL